MSQPSNEMKRGFIAVLAVAEAVREAKEIPAGTVYAALMTQNCTLEAFDKILGILGRCGLVERKGDLLRWIGPNIEGGAV